MDGRHGRHSRDRRPQLPDDVRHHHRDPRPELRGAPRRDLRPSRLERLGQDDDRSGAAGHLHPHRWSAAGRGSPLRPGAQREPGLPARGARPVQEREGPRRDDLLRPAEVDAEGGGNSLVGQLPQPGRARRQGEVAARDVVGRPAAEGSVGRHGDEQPEDPDPRRADQGLRPGEPPAAARHRRRPPPRRRHRRDHHPPDGGGRTPLRPHPAAEGRRGRRVRHRARGAGPVRGPGGQARFLRRPARVAPVPGHDPRTQLRRAGARRDGVDAQQVLRTWWTSGVDVRSFDANPHRRWRKCS